MKPIPGSYQGVKRSSRDLDPGDDKILIIGSGILTILILITLYLLAQRTLTALTILSEATPFVVEVRYEPAQRASCVEQPLITPSEIRGSAGEPVILKLTPPPGESRWRASLLKLQVSLQAASLPVNLTVYKGEPTIQPLCSRCHSSKLMAPSRLTFVVNRFIKAETRPGAQGYQEVTY